VTGLGVDLGLHDTVSGTSGGVSSKELHPWAHPLMPLSRPAGHYAPSFLSSSLARQAAQAISSSSSHWISSVVFIGVGSPWPTMSTSPPSSESGFDDDW
jgi:hypothetical protein